MDRSFYRFVTIHACDGQTDGQRDGQTDRQFSSLDRVCIACSAVKKKQQAIQTGKCAAEYYLPHFLCPFFRGPNARRISRVRESNSTKLGESVGRSSMHKMCVLDFRCLAPFRNEAISKGVKSKIEANFRCKITGKEWEKCLSEQIWCEFDGR